jgi:hypothetical protein
VDFIEPVFWIVLLVVAAIRWMQTTNRFDELRRTLYQQGREIDALKRALEERRSEEPAPEARSATIVPPAVVHEPVTIAPPPERASEPMRPSAPPPRESIKPKQIEQQFGGRAFVWVGGVALALAGFYLVKYSIDTGLLTEQVRVILGVLFGIALLIGSAFLRARPNVANGARIAQALAGAGIADLYGSLFAATTLYHLIPPWLGLSAMAATTAVALVLSLRHGAPIAILGLIGGYATPMMVQGASNAPLLFGYLYLVFAGLSVVGRSKDWWWLSIPATFVAFAWVVLWQLGDRASHDAAWLSTFLFAIGATAIIADKRGEPSGDITSPHTWRRYFAPTGAVVLLGIVAYTAHFGAFEWAMFGLFSLGAVGLAWFDDRTYAFVPWQAMIVNLVMLWGWNSPDPIVLAETLAAFALLFGVSGQIVLSRSHNPLSWAGLSAGAAVLYFVLAYDLLDAPLTQAMTANPWLTSDMAWSAIAFSGAALMTAAATRDFVLSREIALRHWLQAIFALAATSLLSTGLAILLHQQYLSFALSAEVLAVCWIITRTDIPALKILAEVLTGLFALSLASEAFPLLAGVGTSETASHLISISVFRFGLPAAMFAGASVLLRRREDDVYVAVLELGAIALLAGMAYKILQAIFLGHFEDQTLIIESIYSNILLAMSYAALVVARRISRQTVEWGGVALAAVALLRVVGLGLAALNPLWMHQAVGNLPVLNGLLIAYALPALLVYIVGQRLSDERYPFVTPAVSAIAYGLTFIWVSFAVRQVFNGPYLDSGTISNAEVYAYSAVWLAIGVALLFAAALRKDQIMRYASLAVMLLTVGKVFLYDASQLTGLWRVVSFLGLGLSLLGLSWFYSRFIFAQDKPQPA